VRMNRADPFDEFDGCGDGSVDVLKSGRADKNYNLWSRNPISVSAGYLESEGATGRPPRETDVNY
jgi:Icc protein